MDQALSRLTERGQLIRAGRGVYLRPVTSRFGTRAPSVQQAVEALASQRGEVIVPSGAAAANTLGLTTQVPVRSVYLTSGRSRTMNLGKQVVELRHAPRWQLALAHKPAGEAVRALAWLGEDPTCLQDMRRGLEKEALRVQEDGWLSQLPHPAALGSTLTHPHITTDYSEALIELITPPCDSIAGALGWLDDLHRYVYAHIGSERLWVNSMPCKLGPDQNIPLAQYGTSNIGRMKHVYRVGLDYRYGRRMQAIAGVHGAHLRVYSSDDLAGVEVGAP